MLFGALRLGAMSCWCSRYLSGWHVSDPFLEANNVHNVHTKSPATIVQILTSTSIRKNEAAPKHHDVYSDATDCLCLRIEEQSNGFSPRLRTFVSFFPRRRVALEEFQYDMFSVDHQRRLATRGNCVRPDVFRRLQDVLVCTVCMLCFLNDAGCLYLICMGLWQMGFLVGIRYYFVVLTSDTKQLESFQAQKTTRQMTVASALAEEGLDAGRRSCLQVSLW